MNKYLIFINKVIDKYEISIIEVIKTHLIEFTW